MNKKGLEEVEFLTVFYVIVALIFFGTTFYAIDSNKDDTAYNLKFYARDVAFGSEAMLSSIADEISYVYPLKEGYEIQIDSSSGNVIVSKGKATEEFKFRTIPDERLEVEKFQDSFYINSYLIKKEGSVS